jgi:glutamate-1-semialdehyde aminotransferase
MKNIHDLIPGGAHTYSKGDDQFPSNAPKMILRGKGAYVWDEDGNKFLDCGMGLASVSLGHGIKEVTDSVSKTIEDGTNFMRPSVLENKVASEFLELLPYHDMIKFAKNGSTVTTAAVKLARAYTGRDLILVPEGHPFYSYDDWFIGSTDADFGIPNDIKNLTLKFKACSLTSLEEMFSKFPNKIAAVITEPEKNWCSNCNCEQRPSEFLTKAIEVTKKNGAIFILDEMQSGYRLGFPGAMTKYNLEPHLTTWGKGIANGFSFCCLTGVKELMEQGSINNLGSRKLFLISTTHGAESTGLAAAIATKEFYIKKNVIDHIHEIGKDFITKTENVIKENNFESFISVFKCAWMPGFNFNNSIEFESSFIKTFLLQELVNENILFQGVFVPSYSHTKDDVLFFANSLDKSIKKIKYWMEFGGDGLVGDQVKPVFRKFI